MKQNKIIVGIVLLLLLSFTSVLGATVLDINANPTVTSDTIFYGTPIGGNDSDGMYIEFDGSTDYGEFIGNSGSYSTFDFTIKLDSDSFTSAKYPFFITQTPSPYDNFNIAVNNIGYLVSTTIDSTTVSYNTGSLNTGQVYELRAVYDGTDIKYYLDSVLKETDAITGNFDLDSSNTGEIANHLNTNVFNGRIYNIDFTSGSNVIYQLDATPLTDWSGNGNNAEIRTSGQVLDYIAEGENAWNFDETNNEYILTDDTFGMATTDTVSVSFWYYSNNNPTGSEDFLSDYTSSSNTEAFFRLRPDGYVRIGQKDYDGGLAYEYRTTQNSFSTTTWNNVVGIFYPDTTTPVLYVNGNLQTTDDSGTSGTRDQNCFVSDSVKRLGSAITQNYFDGKISQMQIYDYELSQTNVTKIYNNGAFYNANIVTPPMNITNFTITLKDFYNNNSLIDFTAYVGNQTFNDSGSGIITTSILDNSTELYNITIEKFGYFNKTYLNYNVSDNLEAVIMGSNVTLRIVYNNTNITATVSNTTLTDLNNSLSWIGDTGYFNIHPTPLVEITYNVKCNRQVFEERNITFNFAARDEQEYIIYVEPTLNSFYFYDEDTSLAIPGATIDIIYPGGDVITRTTDLNGMINFSWVNSDLQTDFGNYTFEFEKLGYNLITFVKEINSSNVPLNESYNISRSNLIVNIYNRATGLILNNTNVTLKLLGVFENIISSGLLNYTNLSLINQEYTLQALANGYDTEQQSFDFTNQEDLIINFYLLNLSDASTLFVTSLDESYFRLQNVQDVLYEYSSKEEDFIPVSECYSNSNGECAFSVELDIKLYKIKGFKVINGVLVTDETSDRGEFFYIDNDVRTLVLSSLEEFSASEINKLRYVIDYTKAYELEENNNVSTVSVDFYKTDGVASTLCVQYYLLEGSQRINATVEECTTASSGTVNIFKSYLLNRSNTYEVRVYVKNGAILLLEKYLEANALSEKLKEASLLMVIVSIIWLGVLGVSITLKNIGLFLFISIILAWVFVGLLPNTFIAIGSVVITVINITSLYIIRKKQVTE